MEAPMTLDTMRMRYFAAIAQAGSFTRAAGELRVAQSALSTHMRALEDELGTRLFSRTSRGIVLTDAGETLHSHARSILRAIAQAEEATREQGMHPSGDVVLGIINSLFPTLGIPVLETCKRRFPRIRLAVSEGDSRGLREALESQTHDLAVTLHNVAKPSAVRLFDEALYVVGPPGHFPGADATMWLADALRLPLILPPPKHSIRFSLERNAAALGVALDAAWLIEGLAATKAAIRHGFGFSILARSAVHDDARAGRLSCARLLDTTMSRSLVLDMATNHPPTRAMLEVRRIVLELVRTLGRDGHWVAHNDLDAADAAAD
jgi:LysR family nitrogen assimilation transcriptional regulator